MNKEEMELIPNKQGILFQERAIPCYIVTPNIHD